MMSTSAAPSDAAVMLALEQLEEVRARLHDSLREAAFSLTTAQREEESTRGCLVSFDAVPTAQGSLAPLAHVAETRREHGMASWQLEMRDGARHRPLGSASAQPQASPPATATTEAPADPIYYFSECPSAALRECQAAYRRALHGVVEAVNAQQRALAAAAAAAA